MKINAINGRRGKISSKENGVRQILHSCENNISVKGQIVVKTCKSGNLTYIKYQDIETDVEGRKENGNKKTHHNDCEQSRENGPKRSGRDKLKNVDGDFSACMRLKKESIEDHKKNEGLKGRGGGRLKYYCVDGDMPLCLRKTERKSKEGSSSNEMTKTTKAK